MAGEKNYLLLEYMAGHSHRHIGDIEDLDYVDQKAGFILMYNRSYLSPIPGKIPNRNCKNLKSYSRITIDISLENGISSNRYTAVYFNQLSDRTKEVTRYAFMKTVGSSMNLDLSCVPKNLYVIERDCSKWEGIAI
jgi:hypothetical protein